MDRSGYRIFICFCVAAALMALAGFLSSFFSRYMVTAFAFVIVIYVTMISVWGFSAARRIPHKEIRRFAVLTAGAMLLLIFLRSIRYHIVFTAGAGRYCWYSYYILLMAMSLFAFLGAVAAVRSPGGKRNPAKWLYLPFAVLSLLFLTNDFHHLAFTVPGELQFWNSISGRGPVCYGASVWTLLMLMGAVMVLYRGTDNAVDRRRVWMPLTVIVAGTVYAVLYGEMSAQYYYLFSEIPSVMCFFFALFWESCIAAGLLPNNRKHVLIFDNSTISAGIADEDYQTVYTSLAGARPAPAALRQTEDGSLLLEGDRCLKSEKITGGSVFWWEDISSSNAMLSNLRELNAGLTGSHELLRAEYVLNRRGAGIREQNRLYDSLSAEMEGRFSELEILVDELEPGTAEFKDRLGMVCITGAYLKRRANLSLIGEGSPVLDGTELGYCFRESADYLRTAGISCTLRQLTSGFLCAEDAKLAYDVFQRVIENALPGMTSVLIDLSVDNGSVNLSVFPRRPFAALPEDCEAERIAKCEGVLTVSGNGAVSLYLPGLGKGGAELC